MRTSRTAAAALLTLVVAAFAPGLVACSKATCRSECNRSATLDCDKDGTPDNAGVDCESACALYDTTNAASGCGGKFDEFSSCLSNIKDLCVGTSACDPQLAAWSSCVQAYCVANPGGTGCAVPG